MFTVNFDIYEKGFWFGAKYCLIPHKQTSTKTNMHTQER